MAHPHPSGPLTVAEFFDRELDGVTMTAAQIATGLAYTTVFRARSGGVCAVETAKQLAAWSRTLPSAVAAGVWIDAARTLGLDSVPATEAT